MYDEVGEMMMGFSGKPYIESWYDRHRERNPWVTKLSIDGLESEGYGETKVESEESAMEDMNYQIAEQSAEDDYEPTESPKERNPSMARRF